MRPPAGLGLFVSFAFAPGIAVSQQLPLLDSIRVIIAPPAVQVREPMVLALVHDSLNPVDPRFAPARAFAESLGFDFQPVLTRELQIVDSRYQAVYTLPSDVDSGYLIITPGHRPDVVRGFVEPDSLRRRIARYARLSGPIVRQH